MTKGQFMELYDTIAAHEINVICLGNENLDYLLTGFSLHLILKLVDHMECTGVFEDENKNDRN